jgi:6-phosphogluconolactonase
MNGERQIEILPDAPAIARFAAGVFVASARQAVAARGKFTVALAGGSTPRMLYSLLASDDALRSQTPWEETFFFFGDERCVPPTHADSNYRMAHDAMLSKIGVKPEHVFRMKGEARDAEQAAAAYEQDLRRFFFLERSQLPRFDLVLLGMGPDGHTASLFPGTRALEAHNQLVAANWVGKLYSHRITLTVPVFNSAASTLFMVHGQDKAPALKGVLEGPYEPMQLPSQFIRPQSGNALWLVDESAAALLDRAAQSRGAAR